MHRGREAGTGHYECGARSWSLPCKRLRVFCGLAGKALPEGGYLYPF